VDHDKVCGILIETSFDTNTMPFAIVGIGLNVNGSLVSDPELTGRASTVADAVEHPIEREVLAAALLRQLDQLYTRLGQSAESRQTIRERWVARLATLGRRVQVAQGDQVLDGVAEDVDADGALLLRRDDGRLSTVTWGDVMELR
jgi:BirA family biotin operon repressor/biotin-[acetyl-CoA-carboxylase] ligase